MKTKEKLTVPLMTINDIDINKIPCDSPIPEIQIGTILDYSVIDLIMRKFHDGLFLGSPIGWWIAFLFFIVTISIIYFS